MRNRKKQNKQEKQEIKQGSADLVRARGRAFEGIVKKKFPKRIVIELERIVFMPKYERYYKKKMRIHARLPKDADVSIGDMVSIMECRPLSKIIHHIVVAKVKSANQQMEAKK